MTHSPAAKAEADQVAGMPIIASNLSKEVPVESHFSRCQILSFRPQNITLTSSSIVGYFNVMFGDFFLYKAKLHKRPDGTFFLLLPGSNEKINCRGDSETRKIILDEAIKTHLAADPVAARPPKSGASE